MSPQSSLRKSLARAIPILGLAIGASVQAQTLYNVQFLYSSGTTYSGPAVLGSPGGQWNKLPFPAVAYAGAVPAGTNVIRDSTGSTAAGVTFTNPASTSVVGLIGYANYLGYVAHKFSASGPAQSFAYRFANLPPNTAYNLVAYSFGPNPTAPTQTGRGFNISVNGGTTAILTQDVTGLTATELHRSTLLSAANTWTGDYIHVKGVVSDAFGALNIVLTSQTGQGEMDVSGFQLQQATVPVVLKVSDAVVPGAAFSINGEEIHPATVDVAIALDTTGQSPATPPAGALHPTILQTDALAHYVVARMPPGSTPGVYNVWVKNAAGWSAPRKLNAARALFMSDYEAYSGIDIEVVGRNFDGAEFGAVTATKVRLSNGSGTTYDMPIKDLNPFHVTFTVGTHSLGSYFVEVSSDNGANWSRPDSGQTLTIQANPPQNLPAGNDPLGLGVSWAKDFKWNSVKNVTAAPYNINSADTSGNDTAAVQQAIDDAEAGGGGVVYFPNGNYYIPTAVKLGQGVVLQGQSQLGTKLYYDGAGTGAFIASKVTNGFGKSLQGIGRLSIHVADEADINKRPDQFISLGDPFTPAFSDKSKRAATRIFVAEVNMDYPYTDGYTERHDNERRGIGLIFNGLRRVLLKDNTFKGWYATHAITGMSEYMIEKNNSYEYSAGYVHGVATYSFIENNQVIIHPEYNEDTHGIFVRSDAYVANNSVSGSGANDVWANAWDWWNEDGVPDPLNDGEGIAAEGPGGGYNRGNVTSATATTVTVSPVTTLANPTLYYGDLSVSITHGRGIGQMRKVASMNPAANVITLTKAFDVVPDGSSKFVLHAPLRNFTVFNNTISDCASGILPYGNIHDCVVADNTIINCVGIYQWGVRSTTGGSQCAFTRIVGNSLTGVSKRSKSSAIGLHSGRPGSGPGFYDTLMYSNEILYNTITGDLNQTPIWTTGLYFPPNNGIYVFSFKWSNPTDGIGTGDITNTLIEGNALSSLTPGITLTRSDYGQVISSNHYASSVAQFLLDSDASLYKKSDNTLLTGNALASSTPPNPTAANSRRTHGGGGPYDVPVGLISGASPASGQPSVECRVGGNLTLVMTFNKPITSGQAAVASGIATLSGAPVIGGSTLTVNLSGVSGVQTLRVGLSNVTAADGGVLSSGVVSLRVLPGDVNGDGVVNAVDLSGVRNAYGKSAGQAGFDPRADMNVDGVINSVDTSVIRANYGMHVP